MTTTSSNTNNNDNKKPAPVLEHAASSSFLVIDDETSTPSDHILLPSSTDNCDSLLEQTVDNCVACVDNIDAQQLYEDRLEKIDSHQLSATEASQIRLSAMEESNNTTLLTFPDLDELNICGTDDLEDAKTTLKHSVHSSTTTRPSSPPSLTCAICDDTVESFQNTSTTFCHFPCCAALHGKETTKVCTACMLLLSFPTSDKNNNDRIGRCPLCRSWLVVRDGGLTIEKVETGGTCKVCNQVKQYLVESEACDACFFGKTRPLYYECQQCGLPQQIPHPMYRYQGSVEEFGTTSWACQQQCQNFTKWRILPDGVSQIPAGDAPVEWGDDYLETARARVLEARQHMRELNRSDTNGGCCIQ